jgi:endonuclease YncB( thermonuclease family)
MLREGHALWLPQFVETRTNALYSKLAQQAALRRVGIWNPTYCGNGPSEGVPLRVTVNPKHTGSDLDIPGEWVRIRSFAPYPVPLGGWWVRDSGLRRYTFPSYATVAPGDTVTVYVGGGEDSWTEFFWGLRSTIFDNPRTDPSHMGDGAYLFDPQGDLRAWMQYPCRENCSDQYAGAVKVTAQPKGRDEHVTVRNVAAFAVDLDGYRLQSPPYTYAFPRDSVLQPGEEMEIEVLGDPAEDSRLQKHWGEVGPILNNNGDRVKLTSFREIVLDCYAYGSASC